VSHTGIMTSTSSQTRGRSVLPDVVLATIVIFTAAFRAHDPLAAHRVQIIVFSVALGLPLIWRRRSPLLVFGIVCVFAFAQWLTTVPVVADVALLIAFYTVAATQNLRWLIAAAVTMEVGVVLAVLRYHQGRGPHEFALGMLFLSVLVVAAGVIGMNIRVRRAYLHEVEQRAARLEFERDQQGQLAVAAERSRIAREMHDVIAHNLTVMVALADGAALTTANDPDRAAAAMRESSATGRRALREMRTVLGVLREDGGTAELAPAPGLADLDRLVGTIRRTGLDATLTWQGALPEDLPPSLELSIYRLVQESLTNTVKHARGADRVSVVIRRQDEAIDVSVTDNGRVVEPAVRAGGHGIVGMRERVTAHGGTVSVGPLAAGWLVHATFPVTESAPVLTHSR
jgi:signal transduction histidine kinase